MPGSSFSQGDHATQLWKSFTCAKTAAGEAEMVAVRVTRKLAGCNATTTTRPITITATTIRIFQSIEFRLLSIRVILSQEIPGSMFPIYSSREAGDFDNCSHPVLQASILPCRSRFPRSTYRQKRAPQTRTQGER